MHRGGGALCVSLLLAAVSAPWAWPAPLTVTEATLYQGSPAEVKATVALAGAEGSFDLPKGVLPESVQATQSGAPVSVALQAITEPPRDARPAEVARCRAQLSGLQTGVPVEMSFRVAGLEWKPACALTLATGRADLRYQASITNNALDLTGARLLLMSGYSEGRDAYAFYESGLDYGVYTQIMRDLGRDVAMPGSSSMHLALVLEKLDIPIGSTRQVPVLVGPVQATRSYRWNTQGSGPYADYGGQPERVYAVYSFPNTFGKALPEARITVTEQGAGTSGALAWTPAGEAALVVCAGVPSLSVRRREETTPQPKTWESERKIVLSLGNGRDDGVTVRVTAASSPDYGSERGSDTIYQFSQQPLMTEKRAFVWEVPVAAHRTAEVSYSYREPIDMTPLRLLKFTADDSLTERSYLVAGAGSAVRQNRKGNPFRTVLPGGSIVYRLPVPAGVARAELAAWIGNAFRVSLAPEVKGAPGPYTVAADARAIAGRSVSDGEGNYTRYIFDLTPFLSATSRAVYFRIDDPSLTNVMGGAFLRTAEVVRIPDGFPSRAPKYPVEVTEASAAGEGAAARPLHSFAVFTPEEKPFVYADEGTWQQDLLWPDRVRVADGNQKITYAFTLPPEVTEANLAIRIGNQFAIAVARDAGGKPGEFHEELNAIKQLGHTIFLGENYREYNFALTPYLQDNPARRVYVTISDADTSNGCGAVIARMRVTVLDAAEKARLARAQEELAEFVEEQRRVHVYVLPDGGKQEAAYLYEDHGSRTTPLMRVVEGPAYVIYRFPLRAEDAGEQCFVSLVGDFSVSLAAEQNGKPGSFEEVLRAREEFSDEEVETRQNLTIKVVDVTPAMLAAGACYVKVADGAPEREPGVTVLGLGMKQPEPD